MLTVQKEAKRLEEWNNTPDIQELLKVISEGDILEIGCGTGRIIEDLAKTLTQSSFTGIDLQPYFINIAEGKKIPNARFIVADAMDNVLPAESFDYIVFRDVLHQIYDHVGDSGVLKALENAYSYLRTGGSLIMRDAVSSPPQNIQVKMNRYYSDLFSVYMKNSVDQISVTENDGGFVLDVSDLVSFLGKAEKLRLNPDLAVVKRVRYSVDEYNLVLSRLGFSQESVCRYRYSSHLIPEGIEIDGDQLPTTYCMLVYSK